MNGNKSRTRHRHRICDNCGGRYQVVLVDADGETRRECGCFVRVVPTRVEDVAPVEATGAEEVDA